MHHKTSEQHMGHLVDEINGFQVIECQMCGFKHIHPLPTLDELEKIYRHEYYTLDKPLFLQEKEEDKTWWNTVYSDRYDTFEEFLPTTARRILDVGSGPGYFVSYGQKRGWKSVGVEPSAQACEHARGLGAEVVENFFNHDTATALGKFDAIHANAVLEHIPNPREMVSLFRESLVQGGILCVVVPNDYNPFQETLRTYEGYRPWWVAPPHHLNYFNFETLGNLLVSEGFEVVMQETTFPIDMFLLMGDNYVDSSELGRACHKKRMRFDTQMLLSGNNKVKRRFYQALASVGMGREVVLFAKKV
ncbi:class I SAM-dependent methyltransferase [Shewanella sp. GD03713]|uniref:class I SAM-dependent methyltransferase n=1 Tax=Shewanella sp. GD03713 TaxID=2975372 RepID=UPI000B345621|nr:class I SAM-dependent methyltransferase [Shewanella sp. GD03713]MDH1469605.1 class I SAM-dependent methyltransferase [Shewanella sp. GD03713]